MTILDMWQFWNHPSWLTNTPGGEIGASLVYTSLVYCLHTEGQLNVLAVGQYQYILHLDQQKVNTGDEGDMGGGEREAGEITNSQHAKPLSQFPF